MAEISEFLSSKAEKQLQQYEDSIKKIVDLYAKFETSAQALDKTQQGNVKTQKDLDEQTKQYNSLLAQLNTASAKLQVAESNLNKEVIKKRAAITNVNNEIKKAIQLEDSESNSINKLTAENKKLIAERNKLSTATKEGRDQLASLNKQIQANTETINKNGTAAEKQKANIGNYASALKGIGSQFFGALGITTGITAFTTALVSTGKQVVKFNRYSAKLEKQFDLTAEQADNAAIKIQTLSENFDKSNEEIQKAANTLSREFDIDIVDSLDLINEGFEKGADLNGDFLDQLAEYPAQLKTIGLSAEDTIAIITQNVKEGVFSDKGIDAIKEAGLRIREMPAATASALDSIGLSSQKIQKEISSGVKTTFEVIQEVSSKLNELPEQSSAVGTAIADIFGGAGEDAGIRYLKSLKDINLELDSLGSKIDITTQNQNKLNESWITFIASIGEGDSSISKLYNSALKNISSLLDYISGKKEKDELQLFTSDMEKESEANLLRFKTTYQNSIDEISKKWTDLQLVSGEADKGDVEELESLYSKLDIINAQLLERQKELNYEYDDTNDLIDEMNRLDNEQIDLKDSLNKKLKDTQTIYEHLLKNDIPDALESIYDKELESNKKIIDSANKTAVAKTEAILKVRQAEEDAYNAKQELTQLEMDASINAAANVASAVAQGLGESTAAGKVAAIATATIDGYIGVQKAFNDPSNLTLFQRIAAAAAAGAFAINNVRNILNTDTTVSYATGTTNSEDTFIAGEAGRELLIDKKGNVMMVNGATLFTNMAGSTILKNSDTENIMRSDGKIDNRINLDPLINAINLNKSVQNVSMDKYGIISVSNNGISKTKYINRKFRHKA